MNRNIPWDYALAMEDMFPPIMDGNICFERRQRTFYKTESASICIFPGCTNRTTSESRYCGSCAELIRVRQSKNQDIFAPKNSLRKKYAALSETIRNREDFSTLSLTHICREYKISKGTAIKIKRGEY
jgi:hypothetical protein